MGRVQVSGALLCGAVLLVGPCRAESPEHGVTGITTPIPSKVAAALDPPIQRGAISLENVEISEIIRNFSERLNRRYVFDDQVHGKATVYVPDKVSPEESAAILESVLSLKGLKAMPVSEHLWKIVPIEQISNQGPKHSRRRAPGPPTPALPRGSSDDPAPGDGNAVQKGSRLDFQVRVSDLDRNLENIPLLLSQARAIPYFRNGRAIAIRIFAIKEGSIYKRMGFENGDIIKTLDSDTVTDPAYFQRMFEKLKQEGSLSIRLERGGEEKEIALHVGGPRRARDEQRGSGSSSSAVQLTDEDIVEALRDRRALLEQIRAVPYYRNGLAIGIKVSSIRQGGVWDKIRLENGDIVTSMNGTVVTTPNILYSFFERLREKSSMVLIAEREGEEVTMHFQVTFPVLQSENGLSQNAPEAADTEIGNGVP